MGVLVDTSVWSLAVRRTAGTPSSGKYSRELADLIITGNARIIGPIRQELLSGIKHVFQYEKLKSELSVFIDLELFTADFEYAAELFNLLRGKGIQGTSTDLLICAVALRYDLPIFTVDRDFTYYAQHIPVKLYKLECSPVD